MNSREQFEAWFEKEMHAEVYKLGFWECWQAGREALERENAELVDLIEEARDSEYWLDWYDRVALALDKHRRRR